MGATPRGTTGGQLPRRAAAVRNAHTLAPTRTIAGVPSPSYVVVAIIVNVGLPSTPVSAGLTPVQQQRHGHCQTPLPSHHHACAVREECHGRVPWPSCTAGLPCVFWYDSIDSGGTAGSTSTANRGSVTSTGIFRIDSLKTGAKSTGSFTGADEHSHDNDNDCSGTGRPTP